LERSDQLVGMKGLADISSDPKPNLTSQYSDAAIGGKRLASFYMSLFYNGLSKRLV
jgi:hypothetical protein